MQSRTFIIAEENKMKGLVHSLETFGLVDGPGVRYIVFMQGCRMRCQFCHNPETWDMENGELWEAKDLFERAYRYKTYWMKNGKLNGGITVSGGEPLLQIDFVTEFFKSNNPYPKPNFAATKANG